jgi:hypothetical protein
MGIPSRSLLSALTAITLVAAGSGCSGDGDSSLAPVGPSASVSVAAAVARITVSPVKDSIAVGDSVQLTATAYDRRGAVITGVTFTWSSSRPGVASVSSAGLVTGVKVGDAAIRAKVGKVVGRSRIVVTKASGPNPPPPPPPPPPADTGWTHCSAAGQLCQFIGLRDVRLGGPNGPYIVQEVYHIIPCALYAFGNQNPAPGQPLHCDYGPMKTTTLVNPMPGMGGLGPTVTVALGSPGASGPRIQNASYPPSYTDGSGSFRTTCSLSKYAFDDPIVYPGQRGASHLHVFFGNTAVDATSTPQSIAGSGNSTCRGGTLNRTAYWAPALVDVRDGSVLTPDEGIFYYKTGYNMDPKTIKAPPAGLRMIAGDKNATAAQPFVDWGCANRFTPGDGSVPTTCPVGDAVRLTIIFPQCWDGRNLDSPDHKSHMAYPVYRNPPQRSTCPASHPVPIPEITEIIDYPVTATSAPAFWRLSSDMYGPSLRGGFSAHADWMNGWDAATMNTLVTQCLNKALDCGVGPIGNGKELY